MQSNLSKKKCSESCACEIRFLIRSYAECVEVMGLQWIIAHLFHFNFQGGYPTQQPGGYPGQQPGGYPGQPAGGYPGQSAGGYPGQQPGGYPGQPAGGYPGQQPSPQQFGGYGAVSILFHCHWPPTLSSLKISSYFFDSMQPGASPDVQNMFNAVDTDRSGRISAKELQGALQNGKGEGFSDRCCELMICKFCLTRATTLQIRITVFPFVAVCSNVRSRQQWHRGCALICQIIWVCQPMAEHFQDIRPKRIGPNRWPRAESRYSPIAHAT